MGEETVLLSNLTLQSLQVFQATFRFIPREISRWQKHDIPMAITKLIGEIALKMNPILHNKLISHFVVPQFLTIN
jgi:hypothetical protein